MHCGALYNYIHVRTCKWSLMFVCFCNSPKFLFVHILAVDLLLVLSKCTCVCVVCVVVCLWQFCGQWRCWWEHTRMYECMWLLGPVKVPMGTITCDILGGEEPNWTMAERVVCVALVGRFLSCGISGNSLPSTLTLGTIRGRGGSLTTVNRLFPSNSANKQSAVVSFVDVNSW